MFLKSGFCFILLMCVLTTHVFSQNIESDNKFLSRKSSLENEKPSKLSPYHLDFKNEVPYIATTAGLFTVGLVLLKTNKKDPFTVSELDLLDRNDVNSFDRGATFKSSSSARKASDILFQGSTFLPYLVFLTSKNKRSNFLSLFVMSAEAYLISGGLNLNSKHIFNRTRPYAYNEAFSIETRTNKSSRLSFFSGHTSQTATATFFIAKVLDDYYPNMNKALKVGMWTTAFAIPALTGYLRVESGRHYNTDVITGFLIGASVGYLVPHLHKSDSKISLNPIGMQGGMGMRFTLKLS